MGYEALIDFCRSRKVMGVPGDVVEIGAFCGGGTYKLGSFLLAQGSKKKVYAIDCFDIQVDHTRNTDGNTMAGLYEAALKGKSQRGVFDEVTGGLPNIVVIAEDSRTVELPAEAVCFGFIDGNHAEDYVVSDFSLVWKRLSPGGVVAFHDYGYDLPGVTTTVDVLRVRHGTEIGGVEVDEEKHIIYIRKGEGR